MSSSKHSKFGMANPPQSSLDTSYSSNVSHQYANFTQYGNSINQDSANNQKMPQMKIPQASMATTMAGKSPRSQMAFLQTQKNQQLEEILAKLQQDNAYLIDILNAAKLERDNIARKIEKSKQIVIDKSNKYSVSTTASHAERACLRKVIMRETSKFEQKLAKQNDSIAMRNQILIEWAKLGTKICVEQPYIPVKGILEVTCSSVPNARVASLQLYKDYITNLKQKAIKSGNQEDINIFSELQNKITLQLQEIAPASDSIQVPGARGSMDQGNMESKYGEIDDKFGAAQNSYLTTVLSPPQSGRVRTGQTRGSRQRTPGGGFVSESHPSTAASSILQSTNYFLGEEDADFDSVGYQENAPVPRMIVRNRTDNSKVKTLDEINLLDAAKALGFTEDQLRKMNFGQNFATGSQQGSVELNSGGSKVSKTGPSISGIFEGSYTKDFDAVLHDIDAEISISQRNKNNYDESQMELSSSNQMDNESNWQQTQQSDINLFTNYLSQEYGDDHDDDDEDDFENSYNKKQFQHPPTHIQQQLQQQQQGQEPVIQHDGLVDFILDFVDNKEATRKKPEKRKVLGMAKKLHAP